jgi:hypothetical protein
MLTVQDFNTHIYPELIEAIERQESEAPKLETAIRAAILQAKGYLSRFDIPTLFGAEGEERDEFLLKLLKDMAVWNFILIANPNINTEFHRVLFEDAIKELGKIQSGKVVPYGWPPAVDPESNSTFFHVRSNPRRGTSY